VKRCQLKANPLVDVHVLLQRYSSLIIIIFTGTPIEGHCQRAKSGKWKRKEPPDLCRTAGPYIRESDTDSSTHEVPLQTSVCRAWK